MKKVLLILTIIMLNTLSVLGETSEEIPVGYVKLHSGAIVPIEDTQPASGRYLNTDPTPNRLYSTPKPDYTPYINSFQPKVTGYIGRGFNFFGLNMGNFNFGIMR